MIDPGHMAPIIGGVIGAASGLGTGLDQRFVINRRHKDFGNFTELKKPSHLLSVQIQTERAIANRYLTVTHPLF